MSLLKCPECGGKVSEYAEQCPECGCPIAMIKKVNESDETPSELCNINGVKSDKEKIKSMIEENTIYNYLLNECNLPGSEARVFMNVIEFNNNEIPDDYLECLKKLRETNQADIEKNAVHCKYCDSTKVEKMVYAPLPYIRREYWYCNNCHSKFDL